jgi:adenosine deaminase
MISKLLIHTIEVMQREPDIVRVAKEAVIDLADDGVIYAEIRVAPEHFTKKWYGP